MKPVDHNDTNFVYKLPGGTDENDLPCRREHGRVTSWWRPSDSSEEASICADARLVVWVWWPNVVGVELEVGDDSMTERTMQLERQDDDDGPTWAYVANLSYAARSHLRNGGCVKLTVDMQPPPPVAITPFIAVNHEAVA